MDRPSKRPELGEVLKVPVHYARRSKEGLTAALADARLARLAPPHPSEHARRFFYGFSAPLTLLRLTWRDGPARQLLVRCLWAPLACVSLVAAIGVAWSVQGMVRPGSTKAAVAVVEDHDDDGDEDDDKEPDDVRVAAKLKEAGRKLREARPLRPPPVAPASATVAPPAAPPARFSAIRTALDILESRVVQVLAVIGVVEWILVWIGREHHDQIAYEASVLAGVPGEPLTRAPRLRLDAGWLWLKLWRAVRFLLFLALVGPIAWLVGKIPLVGSSLAVGVELAWTAYWASVFAMANTFLAWEPVADGVAPWFIRVLAPVAGLPILGIPARAYAWGLTLATRKVWPACMAFEATTWESAGLAAARTIASAPLLYLVFRPMFTPAATHAYVARRPTTGTSPPSSPPQ